MPEDTKRRLKDQLEAFENDTDFRILKQKYETPNAFTIMGNKRREEWHSNFICWLLDPKENHRLGKFPLEKFIELVENKRENLVIDKTDIANMEFETERKIEIERKFKTERNTEKDKARRIDILGISPSLVLVIENKIKANETKAQSNDYYEYCEKEFKDRERCYVLLKAFSRSKLVNKNFIPITYQELFNEVIEPAYEYSQILKLEDTKNVLDQYILDISNPFADSRLANTQKELSKKIYEKHKEIIGEIRKTMQEAERDDESDVCQFFNENRVYINKVILTSLGESIIEPRKSDLQKLRGAALLKTLLDYGYIIPNQTEIIYKCKSATCIIMVDENSKYYAGCYHGTDYDGSQEVGVLKSECETFREAEIAAEEDAGRKGSNLGISAYEVTLLHAGVKEAEGKKIGDILKKL